MKKDIFKKRMLDVELFKKITPMENIKVNVKPSIDIIHYPIDSDNKDNVQLFASSS